MTQGTQELALPDLATAGFRCTNQTTVAASPFPAGPSAACALDAQFLASLMDEYSAAVNADQQAGYTASATATMVTALKSILARFSSRQVSPPYTPVQTEFSTGLGDVITGEDKALTATSMAQYKAGSKLIDQGYALVKQSSADLPGVVCSQPRPSGPARAPRGHGRSSS